MQAVYSNFESTNNQCKENVASLNKIKDKINEGCIQAEPHENERTRDELHAKLKTGHAELMSLRTAEKLLLDEIKEKDNAIMKLTEQRTKNSNTINTMNMNIQQSQNKIKEILDLELKNHNLSIENANLKDRIADLTEESLYKDHQIKLVTETCESKDEIIKIVTKQVLDIQETNFTRAVETFIAISNRKNETNREKRNESRKSGK